jgi:hypothetical protein
MSNEIFSYKEALAHGWGMMRKYWKPFLLISIIYLVFQLMEATLENYAGRGRMPRSEVAEVYKDKAQGDKFYKYLQGSGYINDSGMVQGKLQDMTVPADLALPPEFQDKSNDIANFLDQYRYRLPFPRPVYYLLSLILWLISMLMMVGTTKVSLMAARDQEPSASELYTNGNILVPFILGTLCYFLAVLGGLILIIIPGIIMMIMLEMYSYLIIDKGLGPIGSLKRSRVITKGQRGRLFVFGMLLVLVNIAGLLCLVIGLFFTVWASAVAMAYVYDRLEEAYSLTEERAVPAGLFDPVSGPEQGK